MAIKKTHTDWLKPIKGLKTADGIVSMFLNSLSDEIIWETATTSYNARKLARKYSDEFEAVLCDFPSYFTDVFRTITAP